MFAFFTSVGIDIDDEMAVSYSVSRLISECIFEKFNADQAAKRLVKDDVEPAIDRLKRQWAIGAPKSVRMHRLLEKTFKETMSRQRAAQLKTRFQSARAPKRIHSLLEKTAAAMSRQITARALQYKKGAASLLDSESRMDFILASKKIKLTAVEMEKSVTEPKRNVCGRIDAVFRSPDNDSHVYLVDWKLCKNIYRRFGRGRDIFSLYNTRFNRFSLQLNIYKYILETAYKTNVDKMIVIHKDSIDGTIREIDVPDMQPLIKLLFENNTVWNDVVVQHYGK